MHVQSCTDNREDTHRMGLNSNRGAACIGETRIERGDGGWRADDRWISDIDARFERPLEVKYETAMETEQRGAFLTH